MGLAENYQDIEAPESFKSIIKNEDFIREEWG